ncbi:helix-turn-helix domain-containing protein [Listeria booriae]|uniref:helix-turn-helix domain-containing protein n=1 Tax=Listeria booriae TaxID=1552123 RepID=UPI001626DED4|nr:helix-turn-helix domain-containing protein [Listeria booriae]MBC1293251.1 HTH domain-containing protein [Listeria booriae]
MNHFFSQLVADKKIKRQIKLLQAIYEANYPITLDEIADDFGTSKRTLFRDMKDLEHVLPEDNIVEFSTVSGYTINHAHLIEDLVAQVSEQSPLYTIVNNVYEEIFLTIDEWADDLFLSTSTLYRYLGYLKKVLKEFKLDLTLTPVAIVGEEVNIRHFYFHFFYNTNDISSMNRPTEKHQKIFRESYRFFSEVTSHRVATLHRSSLYWIMVTTKRLEQGHTITLDSSLKSIVRHLRAYEFMPQFGPIYFPDIEKQYVTEDEILYATLLTLDNYVYEKGELYETEDLLDKENLEVIHRFLVRAFAALEKELPEKETLSLYVLYLRNLFFLTKLTPLFQKNSMEVNKLIKHRHPVIYMKWLEILNDDPIKKKFGIEYAEDVAVNLAMFTYFSQHGKSDKKKHVLFTFDGKKAYTNYLEILVNSFVNQNVKVTFLVNQHITSKIIEDLDVDIVIYNYKEDSEQLDCVKYRTERMPTEHDWERINNLIFDEQ